MGLDVSSGEGFSGFLSTSIQRQYKGLRMIHDSENLS